LDVVTKLALGDKLSGWKKRTRKGRSSARGIVNLRGARSKQWVALANVRNTVARSCYDGRRPHAEPNDGSIQLLSGDERISATGALGRLAGRHWSALATVPTGSLSTLATLARN
jgi:hypothetical protein